MTTVSEGEEQVDAPGGGAKGSCTFQRRSPQRHRRGERQGRGDPEDVPVIGAAELGRLTVIGHRADLSAGTGLGKKQLQRGEAPTTETIRTVSER